MKVVRVLNNNVVLATDDSGREVILTGWGVGFHMKPGAVVDTAKVTRTFVPEEGRDRDHLAGMLSAIDPEFVMLADDALTATLPASPGPATVVALADHLSFAVQRAQGGVALGPHPLQAEVSHLYPDEYAAARAIVEKVSSQVEVDLPDSEAVAVALHLVNAGFHTDDLSDTYTMTGVFSQLFEIIDSSYDTSIDRSSISAARFITHLRYFFVRARDGRQLKEGMAVLASSLEVSHPEAVQCAQRLARVLELRLGVPLTEDEVAYLALHVARLSSDLSPSREAES